MAGIGSTGCYIDEQENEYAATIIGRTFKLGPVWRDREGRKIDPPPAMGELPPEGATYNPEKVENGNFELELTFRDGSKKLISDVEPSKIFEPAKAPEDIADYGGDRE